ncbi:MCP four helix bundle domain-containing protein, partial [Acidovorax sp.]|uniref:methyl-accepting chemotaxis protein n=1 Tax=Acidovorax sp. TaxID=1872122 RepID=UPI0025C6D4EF
MNQLKISTRLSLAFTLLVLLLVVLGSVGLIRSASQRTELRDVVELRIPITTALGVLANGVNVQAIQFRNLAIFSSETVVKSAFDQVAANRALITEKYKELDGLIESPKGEEILKRMNQPRAEFVKLGDEYIALIRQGNKEAAVQLLEEKLRPTQLAYQATIEEQTKFQGDVTSAAGQRAEASAMALQRDVLIAGVISIALAIFLAVSIIRSITRPLESAVKVADSIAAGDLGTQITVHSKDETGQLLGALQRMQQSLASTVSLVRQNAEGVASASSQIASGNNDLSARTEQQASALEETAASMEELGSTVRQNADNARTANQLAMTASTVASQGGQVVAEVVETMKGINASSNKIADI